MSDVQSETQKQRVDRISEISDHNRVLNEMRLKRITKALAVLPDACCADMNAMTNPKSIFEKMDEDKQFNGLSEDAYKTRKRTIADLDIIWSGNNANHINVIIDNITDIGRLLISQGIANNKDPFEIGIGYVHSIKAKHVLEPDHVKEQEGFVPGKVSSFGNMSPTTLIPTVSSTTTQRYLDKGIR